MTKSTVKQGFISIVRRVESIISYCISALTFPNLICQLYTIFKQDLLRVIVTFLGKMSLFHCLNILPLVLGNIARYSCGFFSCFVLSFLSDRIKCPGWKKDIKYSISIPIFLLLVFFFICFFCQLLLLHYCSSLSIIMFKYHKWLYTEEMKNSKYSRTLRWASYLLKFCSIIFEEAY